MLSLKIMIPKESEIRSVFVYQVKNCNPYLSVNEIETLVSKTEDEDKIKHVRRGHILERKNTQFGANNWILETISNY